MRGMGHVERRPQGKSGGETLKTMANDEDEAPVNEMPAEGRHCGHDPHDPQSTTPAIA